MLEVLSSLVNEAFRFSMYNQQKNIFVYTVGSRLKALFAKNSRSMLQLYPNRFSEFVRGYHWLKFLGDPLAPFTNSHQHKFSNSISFPTRH